MRADDIAQTGIRRVSILALGFEAMDMERLNNIFTNSSPGQRNYILTSLADGDRYDILFVNYDNPSALRQKEALLGKQPSAPVVAASRGPLSEAPPHHLRGMLIAARVLGILEKIVLPDPPATPQPAYTPIAAKPAPDLLQAPPTLSLLTAPPPEKLEGYRALVVDDSVAIQKSLEMNLASLDKIAGVDFADSGEIALDMARAMKYDLIFLDVMMPGIDGYETCSRLRKLPEYKKTPIIMVSGKNSPMDEVKGVIAGCTTYLTKPVQQEAFQKLSRRVLSWLENYQPTARS